MRRLGLRRERVDGRRVDGVLAHLLGSAFVCDDAIIVRRAVTPPGGAADENGGSFADEAERLGFGAIPYGVRLTDA